MIVGISQPLLAFGRSPLLCRAPLAPNASAAFAVFYLFIYRTYFNPTEYPT
jgi:hypothetical protein